MAGRGAGRGRTDTPPGQAQVPVLSVRHNYWARSPEVEADFRKPQRLAGGYPSRSSASSVCPAPIANPVKSERSEAVPWPASSLSVNGTGAQSEIGEVDWLFDAIIEVPATPKTTTDLEAPGAPSRGDYLGRYGNFCEEPLELSPTGTAGGHIADRWHPGSNAATHDTVDFEPQSLGEMKSSDWRRPGSSAASQAFRRSGSSAASSCAADLHDDKAEVPVVVTRGYIGSSASASHEYVPRSRPASAALSQLGSRPASAAGSRFGSRPASALAMHLDARLQTALEERALQEDSKDQSVGDVLRARADEAQASLQSDLQQLRERVAAQGKAEAKAEAAKAEALARMMEADEDAEGGCVRPPAKPPAHPNKVPVAPSIPKSATRPAMRRRSNSFSRAKTPPQSPFPQNPARTDTEFTSEASGTPEVTVPDGSKTDCTESTTSSMSESKTLQRLTHSKSLTDGHEKFFITTTRSEVDFSEEFNDPEESEAVPLVAWWTLGVDGTAHTASTHAQSANAGGASADPADDALRGEARQVPEKADCLEGARSAQTNMVHATVVATPQKESSAVVERIEDDSCAIAKKVHMFEAMPSPQVHRETTKHKRSQGAVDSAPSLAPVKERTRAFLRTLLKGTLALEEVGADGPPYTSPMPFNLGITKDMRDFIIGDRKISVSSIEVVTTGPPPREVIWLQEPNCDRLLTCNLKDVPRRLVLQAQSTEERDRVVDGVNVLRLALEAQPDGWGSVA